MKRYKISVRVSDHDLANTDEIQMAMDDCWLFGEYEWSEKRGEMRVSALGDLYDNQDVEAFVECLSRTIWQANNTLCKVMISASHCDGNHASLMRPINRSRSKTRQKRRWVFPRDLLRRE
jgi:hypothetical protein